MDSRTIKIKLCRQSYAALVALMHQHILTCGNMDAHGHLLAEHLFELYNIMRSKQVTAPYQDKLTMKLTRPQAVAFMQYWSSAYTAGDPYTDMIVREIIATIDQASKSPATILLQ